MTTRPPGRTDSARPPSRTPTNGGPKPERPMAPAVKRVDVVRYRIYVAGLPSFGSSVMEIGSSPTGTADAPIPDQERSRIRNYLRRFDKRLDKQAAEGEMFLQNPDWRPPPRWYCTPCGQLRSYEDRFCRLCGNARPEEEPDGR